MPAPNRGPRRLRIGIDAHAIGERKTGNERFIANLIPELRARCDHDLVLYFTRREGLDEWRARGLPATETRLLRPAHPLVRIPFSLAVRAAVDRLDVLLVQYTAPPILRCPVVTVVHDVAFRRHPEFFSSRDRAWMRLTIPTTMRRAALVVTVSEFSRDEIVAAYGLDPSRIVVAPNGVAPEFLDPAPRPAVEEPPFFLALGNLQPRKNLVTLIAAYRMLVRDDPDVQERLVVVGQPWHETGAIREAAGDLVTSGRVRFTGYLHDDEVVGLMQRATVFAYPSVYEGFGLPVVEAMAAGAPVAAADIPVMREVAGDAAALFPASDARAWAEGLRALAGDPRERARLVAAGRARAREFTWGRSAEAVLSALEQAARPGLPSRR